MSTPRLRESPMTERVFLHVGSPKSGTTYLQRVLRHNQDRLADQGVLVAGRTHGELVHAGFVVREDPRLANLPPEPLAPGTGSSSRSATSAATPRSSATSSFAGAAAGRPRRRSQAWRLRGARRDHLPRPGPGGALRLAGATQVRPQRAARPVAAAAGLEGAAGGMGLAHHGPGLGREALGRRPAAGTRPHVTAPRRGAARRELWDRFAEACSAPGRGRRPRRPPRERIARHLGSGGTAHGERTRSRTGPGRARADAAGCETRWPTGCSPRSTTSRWGSPTPSSPRPRREPGLRSRSAAQRLVGPRRPRRPGRHAAASAGCRATCPPTSCSTWPCAPSQRLLLELREARAAGARGDRATVEATPFSLRGSGRPRRRRSPEPGDAGLAGRPARGRRGAAPGGPPPAGAGRRAERPRQRAAAARPTGRTPSCSPSRCATTAGRPCDARDTVLALARNRLIRVQTARRAGGTSSTSSRAASPSRRGLQPGPGARRGRLGTGRHAGWSPPAWTGSRPRG